MLPPLLLTRPEAASARFAAQWRARMGKDASTLIAPVLTRESLRGDLSPERYEGIIFTSEAAVAALDDDGNGQLAWCVGEHTAATARQRGFDARAAEGDANSLVAMIVASGERGPFLHARGRESRGAVAGRLRAAGVACDEQVVYVQHTRPLSDEALALLAGPAPVLVPVFSPNSATRLGDAAGRARAPVLLAAISQAAADAWTGPRPRDLSVAARPDAEAMIEALEELVQRLEAEGLRD